VAEKKGSKKADKAKAEAKGKKDGWTPPPPCFDCRTDATERIREMFVGIVQKRRIELGQNPAMRPVFLKPHGIAHGRFEMRPDLPKEMKVGVFAMKSLAAWVRFSSDTLPTLPDQKSTLGIGIKLFGVPGKKLLGDGDTQDFILQNHDVFFVNTAADFCEFTYAGVVQGDYDPYLKAHPETAKVLKEMEKVEPSCLTTTYWSVLPYAYGPKRFVKYRLVPECPPAGHVAPYDDADYLATDLQSRLLEGEVRFRFEVQFFTNDKQTPLDRAMVRWDTPFVQVATLVLPRQDVCARGQAEYGENLAWNAWHCLTEHEPQGSISAARKVVYEASSVQRRMANGVQIREPGPARPAEPLPEKDDTCIVKAAIYPPIGIARVGNSETEWYIGPEVPDPLPRPPGFYRDADGRLKREAARFRVYGLNAKGVPVAELTAQNAKIEWAAHLVNQKSAWFQFQLALDIPEAADAPPTLLRNGTVADRRKLTIDGGTRHVSGAKKGGGASHSFVGSFMDKEVYLGEVLTDEAGRLIVLGGHGKSASYDGSKAVTFANNEGWHDDVGDGPVTAKVTYNGQELEVAPAWVVVAPPNYAPAQKSVRTMWDLMRDLFITAGTLPKPVKPSFNDDIRPIFERLTRLQWVNAGFAAAFGWKGPFNLSEPRWMERLSSPSMDNLELRRVISNQFRRYEVDAWSPKPWPWLYGDAMSIPPAQTPRQNSKLSDFQLWCLDMWAAGEFVDDYRPNAEPPRTIEQYPVHLQGDMLTRAAMDFCLADAFHPGCEMTWPMRTASMYMAPFRLKHAEKGSVEPAYAAPLTQDTLTLPYGPLGPQYPGGITRWMAVPWQTDTSSCRSGYDPDYDPYVPSFWPARVPNEVLTRHNYDIVMDTSRPREQRLAAFANRATWVRTLGDKGYTEQINNMIRDYGRMGLVATLPGIPDDPDFPPVMEVEELGHKEHGKLMAAGTADGTHGGGDHHDRVDLRGIDKVRRFPHGLGLSRR